MWFPEYRLWLVDRRLCGCLPNHSCKWCNKIHWIYFKQCTVIPSWPLDPNGRALLKVFYPITPLEKPNLCEGRMETLLLLLLATVRCWIANNFLNKAWRVLKVSPHSVVHLCRKEHANNTGVWAKTTNPRASWSTIEPWCGLKAVSKLAWLEIKPAAGS